MTEIINLNNCRLSRKNGMYGGAAGNKDGIIYNGEKNKSYLICSANRKKLFSIQMQARFEKLLLPYYDAILEGNS